MMIDFKVLVLVVFLLIGCINQTATPSGQQLNEMIASADSPEDVANLTTKVNSWNAASKNELALKQAQLDTLKLINVTVFYEVENNKIVEAGISCSNNYTQLVSSLREMNNTKQLALSSLSDYLANNQDPTAATLLQLVNSTDADGAYVYAEALNTKYSYLCPVVIKAPAEYEIPISGSDAIALVLNDVVGLEKYYIYSPGFILTAGTVISVRDYSNKIMNRTLASDSWFFMLDKTPEASFSHPVEFVYIEIATGDYYITEESYNPTINGVSFWWSIESRLNGSWLIYPYDSNLSLEKAYQYPLEIASIAPGTPCDNMKCCEGVGKTKALIVNGADDASPTTDAKMMYYYLRSTGLSASDITYLTPNSNTHESDGVTTPKKLGEAIGALAGQLECCDSLFIYLTGHGNKIAFHKFKDKKTGEEKEFIDGELPETGMKDLQYIGTDVEHVIDLNSYVEEPGPAYGVLGNTDVVGHGSKEGEFVFAKEIGDALNSIKACYVTLIYDSCYSGWAKNDLAGKGRTVITSSGTTPSYSGSKTGNSNWVKGWLDAHSSSKSAADTNNDGTVSDKEASDFANKRALSSSEGKQIGTWTSGSVCNCCYVACNASTSWFCTVFEGEGQNDPNCKEVGAPCRSIIIENNDSSTPPNFTLPNITITTPSEPVCGDGTITYPETCDPGGNETDICQTGKKCCPEQCICINEY